MSAFLAVLLSVIMLFNNTLITAVKFTSAKYKAQATLKSGVYSVLADYDYKIKDRYGLYIVYDDAVSYKERLKGYLNDNISYENDNGFIKMKLNSVETETIGFNQLSSLKEQILNYCKYRVPLGAIEEFLSRSGSLFEKLGVKTPSVNKVLEDNKPDSAENIPEEYKKYDMRNKAGNILKNLIEENENGMKINDDTYKKLPSKVMDSSAIDLGFNNILSDFINIIPDSGDAEENITKCINELFYNDKFNFSTYYDGLLINEYIINIFNCKAYSNNESFLKNEVEYIIFGNKSDETNSNYFCALLMLIRYIFNTIYIYTDNEICLAADLAACLATAAVLFSGQALVKNLILSSWSLMEAWEDYKLLSSGKEAPIFKNKETWKTWIHYNANSTGNIKLSYKDYLRIFLMMVPEDVKLVRILDLIQLNVSKERGAFDILKTITKITAKCEMVFDNKRRLPIKAEAEYGY